MTRCVLTGDPRKPSQSHALTASVYVTTSDFPVTKAQHTAEPHPMSVGWGFFSVSTGVVGGVLGVSQTSMWYLTLRL